MDNNFKIQGLNTEQVSNARVKYGLNILSSRKESGFANVIKSLAKEPMILLLLAASLIYFIGGEIGDGIFLTTAILLVSGISLFQNSRSKNALKKLRKFAEPTCRVIRDGSIVDLKSEDLVVGDSLVIEEGGLIAADGIIVQSNDFSVNESILTGEALSVFKDKNSTDRSISMGTTVVSGLAVAVITETGNNTKLGKIGKSLDSIDEEKTPLEIQIGNFVIKMVIAGAVVFVIVWFLNYLQSNNIMGSLLKALTLAMSILPEEIPVAFAAFMALGAWKLMKMGVVVKQMKTVETLGSATVICTDKTGTITENEMGLARVFVLSSGISDLSKTLNKDEEELITLAMWASEPIPFDPMEVALHNAYKSFAVNDERAYFKMVYEYPLSGKPPMMTHIFENHKGQRIIASKGAPEALISVSSLTPAEKQNVEEAITRLASSGYRLLGVGEAVFRGNDFPEEQQQYQFEFKGLVAFYDPPKKNIKEVIAQFYKAGLAVKIITGDNTATTSSIAKEIDFRGYETSATGSEVMAMDQDELREKVAEVNLFTRMFPEAKLKVVNALKSNGEIVAMVGDGVNDGPALKAAHIGIAMGKKGTEIAKHAASLILLEDDLSKMVDAVAMGRGIYANLKKGIRYIISIHIPIILSVLLPLVLGWIYPNIFTPVHIIFFELIMGPTCSIIYENEPIAKDSMLEKPRKFNRDFFQKNELTTSVLQGLVITLATLSIYQYSVNLRYDENLTRSMVFTVLISANIFLTLINRSFYYSMIETLSYKNKLVPLIILVTIIIVGSLLYFKPFYIFFQFIPLSLCQLSICVFSGFLSVSWFELVNWRLRRRSVSEEWEVRSIVAKLK